MQRAFGIITTNYSTLTPSPLSAVRPPAAMPVAGRYRMLDFMLSSMVNCGMRSVGMILPYNYRSVIDHVSSGKDWSLDRKQGGLFLLPGSAFGSARSGARLLIRDLEANRVILEKAGRNHVVLAAASVIMNMDISAFIDAHIQSGADVSVCCKTATNSNSALMGFELEDGQVSGVKMGVEEGDTAFLDCCVMAVDTLYTLLDWYRAVDYLDLFEALAGDLSRVSVRPYYYEGIAMPVFSLQDYFSTSMRFLDPEITRQIFRADRPIHTKAHDNPPAKYEPGATVHHSLVAGGCRIAGTVEDSVIARSVVVEPGAVVKKAIIMQSCVIKSGANLEHVIVDRDNIIAPDTVILVQPKGSSR